MRTPVAVALPRALLRDEPTTAPPRLRAQAPRRGGETLVPVPKEANMAWRSLPWWDQPLGEGRERTFDPERGLELLLLPENTGSSHLAAFQLKRGDDAFTFYGEMRTSDDGRDRVWRIHSGNRLENPIYVEWRALIDEAMRAYGIRFGFTPPDMNVFVEFATEGR